MTTTCTIVFVFESNFVFHLDWFELSFMFFLRRRRRLAELVDRVGDDAGVVLAAGRGRLPSASSTTVVQQLKLRKIWLVWAQS